MTNQDKITRAERAKIVMDEWITPFIKEKNDQLFEAFKTTSASNTDQLRDIKLQSTAINSIEAYFEAIIDDGKITQAEINAEESK